MCHFTIKMAYKDFCFQKYPLKKRFMGFLEIALILIGKARGFSLFCSVPDFVKALHSGKLLTKKYNLLIIKYNGSFTLTLCSVGRVGGDRYN